MRKLSKGFLILAVVGAVLAGASSSRAADDFAAPSLANLVKTLVRFGAIDVRRDEVINAYAKVVECDIYKKHYSDDFTWRKVQAALRESIKQDIETFPTSYRYDAVLELDRYDFKDKIFRFTEKTAQKSSNVFTVIAQTEDFCGAEKGPYLTGAYSFVLDEPVRLEGLPISEGDGKLLLNRMKEAQNKERQVFTRFYFYVAYIAPIVKKRADQVVAADDPFIPIVAQDVSGGVTNINARLDSIEYCEDKACTKLIYRYTP